MNDYLAIKVNSLSVEFDRWGQLLPALIDIDLEVYQQQWVTIIGHNGSGKSTLLKTLAGHIQQTKGTVELSVSSDLSEPSNQFFSKLFYVNQDPLASTADGLTLLENLIVADPHCPQKLLGSTIQHDRYLSLLNEFGLVARANQLMKYFSGGERQQIALLIAKIRNPRILLLDEPFAALDPERVPVCLELIKTMNSNGCTILHVSHDIHFAHSIGHRTIVLERGRILHDRIGLNRSTL